MAVCTGASSLAASLAAVPLIEGVRHVSAAAATIDRDKLGSPGPFPGRVIEARNPAMIKAGVKNREAIKTTLAKGMTALTGATDSVEAWRSFFEPGDVVGVKVVPNGFPLAHTSYELMLRGDRRAQGGWAWKPSDIFVYDRYRSEFMGAKMHEAVPAGIKWGGLTPEDDGTQLKIDFPSFRNDPISGYDRDEFVHMNLGAPYGNDPKDDLQLPLPQPGHARHQSGSTRW